MGAAEIAQASTTTWTAWASLLLGFWWCRLPVILAAFRLVQAIAADVQFQDHAVVDQAVDCSSGCHGVLEYLFPLAERQVARQQHAAPFVALGKEREQHLHLFTALLDVADVVDDQSVAFRQPLDYP